MSTALPIALEVEDGWPPVAVEHLPVSREGEYYRVLSPPLWVKNVSVGDLIAVSEWWEQIAHGWSVVERSRRSTLWLHRCSTPNQIDEVLKRARALGCNTVSSTELGRHSIDVPQETDLESVEAFLHSLPEEEVALAYPSLRHPS